MKKFIALFFLALMSVSPAWATITNTTTRVSYTGDGTVDTYSYTFHISNADDLDVIVRKISDGTETTLTKTTHYTVTGVGQSAGGTVALVNGGFAWLDADGDLLSTYQITIARVLDLTQSANIKNQSDYYPVTHENALDKLTKITQQQQEQIDRTMKVPWGDTVVSLQLPKVSDRASKFLAFNASGAPVAASGVSDVPITSFWETVLDDTSASASLTTLGFSAFVQTLLDDASATVARATLGFPTTASRVLGNDGSGVPTALETTTTEVLRATRLGQNLIINGTLTASVASNALTLAVKTLAGADPSAADPVTVVFRNTVSATGNYVVRTITSALSLVVSSGSTLGHASGQEEFAYVYLLDNAGTVVMGVASTYFDQGTRISTTAEGGAGAADSVSTVYTTAAVSNVGYVIPWRLRSTQTTAGTWAAVPTEIAPRPFEPHVIYSFYETAAGQTIADNTNEIIDFGTKVADRGHVTTGASWVWTAPRDGVAQVECLVKISASTDWAAAEQASLYLYKNGSIFKTLDEHWFHAAANIPTKLSGGTSVKVVKGDTLHVRVNQQSDAARTLTISAQENWISVRMLPGAP